MALSHQVSTEETTKHGGPSADKRRKVEYLSLHLSLLILQPDDNTAHQTQLADHFRTH